MKKTVGVFSAFVLLLALFSGCSTESVQTENSEPSADNPSVYYTLTYYYCVRGDGYVLEETRQMLNDFGEPEYIVPAEPVVEIHTEIPEIENDAKGTNPVEIVLPDLDLSKYVSCVWGDNGDDLEISGCCRVIGYNTNEMTTDELVKVYVDTAGNIKRYETVNLGKYDSLNLDESRLAGLRIPFSSAIENSMGALQLQYFAETSSQTIYRVFTDKSGRIVITTTVSWEQDGRIVEADLYAVVNQSQYYNPVA